MIHYIKNLVNNIDPIRVYEECIVSRVPIRRQGLFGSLNPVRSCCNLVKSWQILYKCVQEEPTALTFNYIIQFLKRSRQTYNTTDLSNQTSYKPSVSYKNSIFKISQCHHQTITTHNTSCNIDHITIRYHKSTLKLRKRCITYTNHFNKIFTSWLS